MKTTNDLLELWRISMMAQSRSPLTVYERLRLITQFESETQTNVAEATTEVLLEWFASLPSAATRHSYYYGMRAWFRWLILQGYLSGDPMAKIPGFKQPKREPRPITERQLQLVLASSLRVDTRAKILLGALAGLRIHEIAQINGRELSLADGLLEVTGKGNRTHVVPLHPALLDLAKHYPDNGYWFPARTSGTKTPHVGSRSVGACIAAAFQRVGSTVTAHQLRHYFATSLLESGADSRIVQKLMRHDDLGTTALYMGVSVRQQQDALQGLDLSRIFKGIN